VRYNIKHNQAYKNKHKGHTSKRVPGNTKRATNLF